MSRPVQPPPDVAPLREALDREYDDLRRDAECYRQFVRGGWVLIRADELAALKGGGASATPRTEENEGRPGVEPESAREGMDLE